MLIGSKKTKVIFTRIQLPEKTTGYSWNSWEVASDLSEGQCDM
jgi:hypothetical protein